MKKPKQKLGKNISVQKYKILFRIHLKYILLQGVIAFLFCLASKTNVEFRHFLCYTLMVGGLWAFPVLIVRRISKSIRPNGWRANIGSWFLQSGICFFLLFLFVPGTLNRSLIAIIAALGAIVLLLFSVKRPKLRTAES